MSKRAVLIGVNYPDSKYELRGCVNDVFNMKQMLIDIYEFDEGNMNILIDTDGEYTAPTGRNIKQALKELVNQCEEGDTVYVHFSGHGTQAADGHYDDDVEADRKDEAIVPTDMNLIYDDDLRDIFTPLEERGVKFTMVADCCHSGSMLDHPEQQISGDKAGDAVADELDPGAVRREMLYRADEEDDECDDDVTASRALTQEQEREAIAEKLGEDVEPSQMAAKMLGAFGPDVSKRAMREIAALSHKEDPTEEEAAVVEEAKRWFWNWFGRDNEPDFDTEAAGAENPLATGVLITGCQSHETSSDVMPNGDPSRAFGALSHSIEMTVRKHKERRPDAVLTNHQLVYEVRQLLMRGGFSQSPCLECEDGEVDDPFIC